MAAMPNCYFKELAYIEGLFKYFKVLEI